MRYLIWTDLPQQAGPRIYYTGEAWTKPLMLCWIATRSNAHYFQRYMDAAVALAFLTDFLPHCHIEEIEV